MVYTVAPSAYNVKSFLYSIESESHKSYFCDEYKNHPLLGRLLPERRCIISMAVALLPLLLYFLCPYAFIRANLVLIGPLDLS